MRDSSEKKKSELFERNYQDRSESDVKTGWDIGRPQPALVDLEAMEPFHGEVLDIGCGLGENAIFLTLRGYRVTGLDSSPAAIQQAQERAAAKGVTVEFAVGDATAMTGYEGRFSTVIDSALYHCLPPSDRQAYISALARSSAAGARLHIFCFSDAMPEGFPVRVSEQNLRETVTGDWNVNSIERTGYTSALTPEELRKDIPLPPKAKGLDPKLFAALETDGQGRAVLPFWHLSAQRA